MHWYMALWIIMGVYSRYWMALILSNNWFEDFWRRDQTLRDALYKSSDVEARSQESCHHQPQAGNGVGTWLVHGNNGVGSHSQYGRFGSVSGNRTQSMVGSVLKRFDSTLGRFGFTEPNLKHVRFGSGRFGFPVRTVPIVSLLLFLGAF